MKRGFIVAKKATGRGGKREGAGRKPTGRKVQFSISVPDDVADWLDGFESRSVKLEELCRAEMGRKTGGKSSSLKKSK